MYIERILNMATNRERAENTAKSIMNNLVNRRKELGLSQAKVAEFMGVTQQQVAKLEKVENPSLSSVCLYAEAVKADIYAVDNEYCFKYAPPTIDTYLEITDLEKERGTTFTMSEISDYIDKDEVKQYTKELSEYMEYYNDKDKLDVGFELLRSLRAIEALIKMLNSPLLKLNTATIDEIIQCVGALYDDYLIELEQDYSSIKDALEEIQAILNDGLQQNQI